MSGADNYSREKNKEINLTILGSQINLHTNWGENQGIRERERYWREWGILPISLPDAQDFGKRNRAACNSRFWKEKQSSP
jgi:hypothetical protein